MFKDNLTPTTTSKSFNSRCAIFEPIIIRAAFHQFDNKPRQNFNNLSTYHNRRAKKTFHMTTVNTLTTTHNNIAKL
jgi:hypothetical protein